MSKRLQINKQNKYLSILKFILIAGFLLIGLLKPYGPFDLSHFFIFGVLLGYFLLKHFSANNLVIFFSAIILAILSASLSGKGTYVLVTVMILLSQMYTFLFRKVFEKLPYILLVHIILFFLVSSYFNSANLRPLIEKEPQAESYFTDHLSFLKVYYLIGQNFNYYSAEVKAHIEDGRADTIPQKSWYWRLPTYAYFWDLLPGRTGISIYFGFLFLSTLMLIFTYKIARIFLPLNLAILSPYLLLPYLHFAARDLAFLEMEWWGVTFVVIGIYFVLKSKYLLSFIFLTLAVFFKETFMIYIATIGLLSFLHKSKKVFYMTILISASLGIYLIFHFLKINNYTHQGLSGLTPTSHPPGPFFLRQTLSYGSWEYLFFRIRPFSLLLILSLISTAFLLIKKELSFTLSILVIPVFVFAISLIKIGSIPFDDYWGAAYVPLLLIMTPILLFKSLMRD